MALRRPEQQMEQQPAQARAEIAERERTILDGIMKATDVMLVYLDRDFNFVAVNPAYAATCRMRPEDMIGRNHFDLYPHEENQAIFRQVRDTGVPVFFKDKPFEFPDQPERGVTYWDWSLTPVKDACGYVIGLVISLRETTKYKLIEEALRQSAQQLRQFIDSAPVAIAMFDTQVCYLAASRRWLADYRLIGQDLHGRSHYEVFPEIPDRWKEIHRRCLKGAVERAEEDPFERADGTIQWLRWEVRPWRSAGGDIGGLIMFSEDISQRKRADQQLRELNATLEQRVAERSAEAEHRAAQLQRLAAELTNTEQRERKRLAQVLHDHLQQLLVGAKLSLSRAQGYVRDSAIDEALQEAAQLINDSLATSRSLTAELSPMILHEGTMPDILRWLARWAQQKYGLSVRVCVSRGADVEAAEIRVALFGAVRELLLNVVKHAGVKQARIGMRCRNGQRIQVVVADRGTGFDFGPASSQPSASGFGLFGIQERLDLLGGQCYVASRPGKGTRASLVVPRQLQAEAAELPRTAMSASPAAAQGDVSRRAWSSERPIRVLLADDHAVVRDGMANLLRLQPDIQIAGQAADGQQAIDLALQLRPDVILMDVSMPRVGGIEATRQIMRQAPGTQIIGLSMFVQEDIAAQMTQAGAVAYLTKTSAPETVIAAIYECTNRACETVPRSG